MTDGVTMCLAWWGDDTTTYGNKGGFMNTRISEIKKQIEGLQIELHKEEHKEKKKKGSLKKESGIFCRYLN